MSDSRTLPAIVLGTAIVVAASIGALAVRSLGRAGDEITVTGSATRPVRSDLAVWRLDITAQAPTQLAATREAAAGAARVRAWLGERDFADSVVTVRTPVTSIQYEWINGMETGRILHYRVFQQIEVRSSAVDRVAELAGDLTSLLDEGVPVIGQAPEYLYAALPALRGPLLADATLDARARAEEIVTAAGAKVGRIKAVRVGVFQVRRRQSTEISDYGMYDTSDRDKDVSGVVRVVFSLD